MRRMKSSGSLLVGIGIGIAGRNNLLLTAGLFLMAVGILLWVDTTKG